MSALAGSTGRRAHAFLLLVAFSCRPHRAHVALGISLHVARIPEPDQIARNPSPANRAYVTKAFGVRSLHMLLLTAGVDTPIPIYTVSKAKDFKAGIMRSMKTDRTLQEVRAQLWSLQREVGTLATEALRLRPSWKLVLLSRKELLGLEERLDKHFQDFMNLDADLSAHAQPPGDMNAAIRSGMQFQLHFGARDSVRGVLMDTSAILNGLRNQLDFRASLALSILAIAVSLIGLVAGVGG